MKIRLDMQLDVKKFKLDLETNRAIFPRMGVKKLVNLNSGINFKTSEGLIISDLKETPANSCQRNSIVNQGRVTYFQTQKEKNQKRC